MTSPACPAWGGVEATLCSSSTRTDSVLHVRADCRGRLISATRGAGIIPRSRCPSISCWRSSYPDGSAGIVGRCNGLRMRSLKPRPVAVSNRPTVTPLSRAQLLHQVQIRRIRPPSARQFRLPFNGLAQSELRRIFCSDEGVLVRIFFMRILLAATNDPPACPAWGWGRIGHLLHSTRTAVSASRESRTRRSPLHPLLRRDHPGRPDGGGVGEATPERVTVEAHKLKYAIIASSQQVMHGTTVSWPVHAVLPIRPLITSLAQGVSRS